MMFVTFLFLFILKITRQSLSACIKLYVYLSQLSTSFGSFGKFCSNLHSVQNQLVDFHKGINCPKHTRHLNSFTLSITILSIYTVVNQWRCFFTTPLRLMNNFYLAIFSKI
jgi:hypothetical protein